MERNFLIVEERLAFRTGQQAHELQETGRRPGFVGHLVKLVGTDRSRLIGIVVGCRIYCGCGGANRCRLEGNLVGKTRRKILFGLESFGIAFRDLALGDPEFLTAMLTNEELSQLVVAEGDFRTAFWATKLEEHGLRDLISQEPEYAQYYTISLVGVKHQAHGGDTRRPQ
jgi:hypothetical protein